MIRQSQGLAGGDADDEDEEDGEFLHQQEALINASMADQMGAIHEGDEHMEKADEDEGAMEAVPAVDPDGWETVARGKAVKGKKKK